MPGMLKPDDFFVRRIKNPVIILNQHRRCIDVMSSQEKIDRHIEFGKIHSHIDGIKLLVYMIICVDKATEIVDFIKQPIFRGSYVTKGIVSGLWISGFAAI